MLSPHYLLGTTSALVSTYIFPLSYPRIENNHLRSLYLDPNPEIHPYAPKPPSFVVAPGTPRTLVSKGRSRARHAARVRVPFCRYASILSCRTHSASAVGAIFTILFPCTRCCTERASVHKPCRREHVVPGMVLSCVPSSVLAVPLVCLFSPKAVLLGGRQLPFVAPLCGSVTFAY